MSMRTCIALLLLGGLASAQQDQGKNARRIIVEMMKRGAISQANLVMQDGFMQWLSSQPGEARTVCAAAAKHVRSTARKSYDEWQELVDKLIKVGEWAVTGNKEDGDALAAQAESLLCRARLNDDPTKSPGTEDWIKAAELYLEVDKVAPEKGKALERAARILRDGARTGMAGSDELHRRAAAICEQGAERYPGNDFFRELAHKAMLDKIVVAMKRDRKSAKKLLANYLMQLQPSVANPAAFSATFFNDVVTLARKDRKLGGNPKYRARDATWQKYLTFRLPEGRRWKWTGSTLYQYDTDGQLMRTFNFHVYRWDINYVADGKKFGGDNIKGLARQSEEDVLTVIVKVGARKALRRQRLNRSIPSSQVFSIGGLDSKGAYLTITNYIFKAKKTRMRTFKLLVLDLGKGRKLDPEAKFVLDSIREP